VPLHTHRHVSTNLIRGVVTAREERWLCCSGGTPNLVAEACCLLWIPVLAALKAAEYGAKHPLPRSLVLFEGLRPAG